MNVQEVKKLDAYLRKLFGNQTIRVVPKGSKNAEVYIGEYDLGELTLDDEDGDLSYNFRMVIQVSNDPSLQPVPVLAAYLRAKFENDKIRVVTRPKKTDSLEAYLGDEFLGVGAGFVLGAATSRPDAERWLIWGDGACGFSLIEFDSFVRHGIPVIAVVGNDAGWTQIAREQVKMLNDDVATVLARTRYERVAEGFGAAGLLVKTAAEVEPALRQARELARGGQPVLVNVWLDRTEFREGSLSM